jgi:CRP/FNR family transcriptional regulator
MTNVTYLRDFDNTAALKQPASGSKSSYCTFQQDDPLDKTILNGSSVFIISTGAIGLRHMLGDGRQTISILFLEGEVLDLRNMEKSGGSLTCLLPVTGYLFDGNTFDRMQTEDEEFRSEQNANHVRQLNFAAKHCVDLARKSAIEKLASYIFECRKRQQIGRTDMVSLKLRRSDIADYLGLRVETLSRGFTKLKQLKLIADEDVENVHILNEPVLRQLANGTPMDAMR